VKTRPEGLAETDLIASIAGGWELEVRLDSYLAMRLYKNETGREVNRDATALYRILWQLDDISAFVSQLLSPHDRTADTEQALATLTRSLVHQPG
jgi:hypothetical protein